MCGGVRRGEILRKEKDVRENEDARWMVVVNVVYGGVMREELSVVYISCVMSCHILSCSCHADVMLMSC